MQSGVQCGQMSASIFARLDCRKCSTDKAFGKT